MTFKRPRNFLFLISRFFVIDAQRSQTGKIVIRRVILSMYKENLCRCLKCMKLDYRKYSEYLQLRYGFGVFRGYMLQFLSKFCLMFDHF